MLETREVRYIPQSVKASITTDVGCVREANEDRGLHIKPYDSETQTRRGTLTVVADGMGGHASGEVASQMAIELIGEHYYSDLENDAPTALKNAIQLANYEIFQTSVSDEKYYGMGTTIIALVLLDKVGYAAHVGDSRLYRLRNQNLEQMTMDHSQVMEMFKQGIISWEETKNHDDKNVILRAVGTQQNVEVEVSEGFEVNPNDEFLLCSDGLCDMVEEDEILGIWTRAKNIHEAGENLVQRAKDNGGHDNVTVAVVRVPAENEAVVSRNVPITREVRV
jgi:PPM family protein phosphatase